jgi:rRNA maturation RNase YbeY
MISFCVDDIPYSLFNESEIANWLQHVAHSEGVTIEELTYIFCSDRSLLKINQQYLDHDYFTDVITFDYRDSPSDLILGDVYLSIERVTDNSVRFNVSAQHELLRVMVHGLLHLVGYSDDSDEQKLGMRMLEDQYLSTVDQYVPRGTPG